MNVNVSEKTESKLKEIAEQQGQDVADYAGVLLEEFIEEKIKGNDKKFEFSADGNQKTGNSSDYANPFEPFIGMFSSGKTDTSTRFKKILREEIDNHGGFGGS